MERYLKEHFYGIECQIILRQENPLYISKIKFGNEQGGHVHVLSDLKLFPFKQMLVCKQKLNLL